jgi:hypothetical protein
MRGSHLGMRTPRVWRRCQRGVRTPSCERRPGDDARFSSGDANSADGGALSTRSSHALVRTAARRRCAVRIWGCELRGWGGRCQRGVRTPSCERRPGDDARFASGDANSAGGGALSTRSSHALVRTAARGDARFASGDANSAGGGGVVNAEFARPRANGGQETMRGSHLGMRTPRMGGRCQRGVRTPSCERRPGDDARFASGDANSADGGALSTRSSHAHGRTAARRRCAVLIWGCKLRGWGGVVNAEFARPRANGGQETMRGSHLGMRTPRMGGRCQRGVRTPSCERRPGDDARFASGDARFASGDANSADGGALSTRSSHALVRTAARRRCAVRIWGCAVRIWGCELRGWGGVVNAEFARPRANGGQETMRGSHLGMRTPRVGGALSTRSSHALVRTAARRRCAIRIWGCELRGWGGRCQRGVRTPSCERRPGAMHRH